MKQLKHLFCISTHHFFLVFMLDWTWELYYYIQTCYFESILLG